MYIVLLLLVFLLSDTSMSGFLSVLVFHAMSLLSDTSMSGFLSVLVLVF